MGKSAIENVIAGGYFGRSNISRLREAKTESLRLLEFIGLADKADEPTKNLTMPDRKKLEIARALAGKPEILLLDEVIAGLNPTETADAIKMIEQIRKEIGITIFMVEHVMSVIMTVSDWVMVLHHGEKISEGKPQEVANDERVIQAYLGKKLPA